jgi:hypothetical protein
MSAGSGISVWQTPASLTDKKEKIQVESNRNLIKNMKNIE